ncbi:hypothetical protein IAI10_14265 [Clostridium sp. 19966]|uniref:BppU family phage baseplate upper protein n=1 Tax=Clostridium sp. 19966 TaxID=2768166 RepID=UPI0028E03D4A|nr:BppU family phage baseplate upper protein [Clostridium sp. 19966]MDT8717829.1 hypothetical protein [Clostridium sp. 19966]
MLNIAQNDMGIYYKFDMIDASGLPINLVNSKVHIRLFRPDGKVKEIDSVDDNSHLVILDEDDGVCQYTIQSTDTDIEGIYTMYVSVINSNFNITAEKNLQYCVYAEKGSEA